MNDEQVHFERLPAVGQIAFGEQLHSDAGVGVIYREMATKVRNNLSTEMNTLAKTLRNV